MVRLFGRSAGNPQNKRNAEKIKEFKRLVKEKRYDAALRCGTEYLSKVPDNHDVLFTVGGIHYMKNRHRTAIGYFDRALRIGSYDVDVLLLKAYSHKRLGEKRQAVECCHKIREIDPKNKQVSELLEQLSPP